MKSNYCHLCFVIDSSGSMEQLTNDTIGSFNSLIAQQRSQPGEVTVTLILFNTVYKIVYNGFDIRGVKDLDKGVYKAEGMTALLDACARGITETKSFLDGLAEKDKPEKVIIVIATDGEENSSREVSKVQLKAMVEEMKAKNWEFVFTGANIDSYNAGSQVGFQASKTMNYVATRIGTQQLYNTISEKIVRYRSGADGDMAFGEKDKDKVEKVKNKD